MLFIRAIYFHYLIREMLSGPFGIIGKDKEAHLLWKQGYGIPVVLERQHAMEGRAFGPQIISSADANEAASEHFPLHGLASLARMAFGQKEVQISLMGMEIVLALPVAIKTLTRHIGRSELYL